MNAAAAPVHPAAWPIERLLAECEIRRTRRSGPGGQHRNKVETAVVITHLPSGVQGEASERRSQELNRQQAIHRLRVNLALQLRTPAAVGQPPSPLWQSRVRGSKLSVSLEHEDFPALLAEALDVLAACDGHFPTAAQTLGISSSQLTKFFQTESHAITQINAHRRARGLRPLQ